MACVVYARAGLPLSWLLRHGPMRSPIPPSINGACSMKHLLTVHIPRQDMGLFEPYNLRSVARAQAATALPIMSDINVESYVTMAVHAEDKRFEEDDMDDAEGVELSLHPLSPLTDSECGLDSDESDTASLSTPKPGPSTEARPPPGNAEKVRKRQRSNRQRKQKRIRLARETLHPAELYTPPPRITESKLKEGKIYKISGDVSRLPTTSGGSWIGKKQQGIGEDPWELTTLMDAKFQYLEWNGRYVLRYIVLAHWLIPCILAIPYLL